MSELATKLEESALARDRGRFAGIRLAADHVEVSLLPNSESLKQHLAERAGGQRVQFRTVQYSQDRLEQAFTKVKGLIHKWRAGGAKISMYGPDVASNAVVLHGDVETMPTDEELSAEFGEGVVRKHEAPPTAWERISIDRKNVSPPWAPGMQLTSNGATSDYCTAGFTVKSSGGWYYLTTAGHCWPYGRQLYNGAYNKYVGYVQNVQFYDMGPDAAAVSISTNSASRYIIGNTGYHPTVSYQTYDYIGDQVCHSGGITGQYCGWNLQQVRICVEVEDTKDSCEVSIAGTKVTQPGDSGAPVYHYLSDGNQVRARGLILVREYNTDTGVPTGRMGYQSMRYIIERLGVTLWTGV